jgi:hypothetical protein
MSHDILKRLGLDHLDVTSPDFLKTLNRLQQEARDSLQRSEAPDAHDALPFDADSPLPGLD